MKCIHFLDPVFLLIYRNYFYYYNRERLLKYNNDEGSLFFHLTEQFVPASFCRKYAYLKFYIFLLFFKRLYFFSMKNNLHIVKKR